VNIETSQIDYFILLVHAIPRTVGLLNTGEFRLLEVDNRIIIAPVNAEIRLLVTASDVIHSGIKIDATQTSLTSP